MKSAIILTSSGALVGALPQGQPAVVRANEPNPTAVKVNDKKLPFIKSGAINGIYCGMGPGGAWFRHTDNNCGTEIFCQGFDDQKAMLDCLQAEPAFKNAKDCFDAHEPSSF
ncbi:uncharacterized protein VB005_08396 [Metarhizium brunneum]